MGEVESRLEEAAKVFIRFAQDTGAVAFALTLGPEESPNNAGVFVTLDPELTAVLQTIMDAAMASHEPTALSSVIRLGLGPGPSSEEMN